MRLTEISIALQTDKPLSSYGKIGRIVEKFGFDRISTYNDLLYQPAWPALFEIARATSSITLGPAAVNPFTSHPINITNYSLLLDQISNGRSYLGLARGAWLDFLGINHPKPIKALRESFQVIEHLMNKNKNPIEGEFFSLEGGDTLRWDYKGNKIPKLLGSWGLKTITSCLEYIDEIKLGGTANPDVVEYFNDQILKIKKANNVEQEIGVTVGAVCVVDEDGDKARKLASKEVALYLPVIASLDPTINIDEDNLTAISEAAEMFDFDLAATYISDELLEKFTFCGTPNEIIDQSITLIKSNTHCIEYGTPHGINPMEGIELLGQKVLPEVKSFMNTDTDL